MNRKGFTLIEMMVVLVIMGMIGYFLNTMLVLSFKSTKRIENRLNVATQNALNAAQQAQVAAAVESVKTRWQYIYIPNQGECKKADAQYWVARTNTRVVTLYKNSTCTQSAGTLNATDNSRFANDVTKTLWEVSGGDQTNPTNNLRILLIIFP